MHVGRSYGLYEFLAWSRGKAAVVFIMSLLPVSSHAILDTNVGIVPWPIILLLGTTVALVAGFQNTQTYNRNVEAQQAWSAIVSSSRHWGTIITTFMPSKAAEEYINRHIAWLTVMRFKLRTPRLWETTSRNYNVAYRRRFRVLEQETSFNAELGRWIVSDEAAGVIGSPNPATHVLNLQIKRLKTLLDDMSITIQTYTILVSIIRDVMDQQARCERIKNFPYPRQYAVASEIFSYLFCGLLPFVLIGQFEMLEGNIQGVVSGQLYWLAAPFSVAIGWTYLAFNQVGESTANPFEGSANDVPITQISRAIEIELYALMGNIDLPPHLQPVNSIAT